MNENDLIKLVRERLDQGAQEIDGIKYPFSDADYARQALGLPAAGA